MNFADEAALNQWVHSTPNLWIFLDYDGTLVNFTPSPNQVIPQPPIIDLVNNLSQKRNLRITILSGRSLPDLQILFPINNIFLAGTYGIDLVTPEGDRFQRANVIECRPYIEKIKQYWEQMVYGLCGFVIEDKGLAVALHARFADENQAGRILRLLNKDLQQSHIGDLFRVISGYKFLEVAPILASKKLTVNYLVEQFPFPGAKFLYLGDDDKDEEAFIAIHDYGGKAIRVNSSSNGNLSSKADYFFESPKKAVSWLHTLL